MIYDKQKYGFEDDDPMEDLAIAMAKVACKHDLQGELRLILKMIYDMIELKAIDQEASGDHPLSGL